VWKLPSRSSLFCPSGATRSKPQQSEANDVYSAMPGGRPVKVPSRVTAVPRIVG
jgi:hypothetical protein